MDRKHNIKLRNNARKLRKEMTKEESVINEIPPDDGHQMSQTEIDNLIALLLNK